VVDSLFRCAVGIQTLKTDLSNLRFFPEDFLFDVGSDLGASPVGLYLPELVVAFPFFLPIQMDLTPPLAFF